MVDIVKSGEEHGNGESGVEGGKEASGAGHQASGSSASPPDHSATRPRSSAAPQRADSFRCPSCGEFGCPAVGGTKLTDRGVNRYRACRKCGRRCITLTPFGSISERVVVSDYGGPIDPPAKK